MVFKCVYCVVKKKPVISDAELLVSGSAMCISCFKEDNKIQD